MRFPSLALLAVVAISCSRRDSDNVTLDTVLVFQAPPPAPLSGPILRVSLAGDAKVRANGREVAPSVLDSLLGATKTANGGVWFYVETGNHQLPSRFDSLFRSVETMIARHKVPVRFTGQADFRDLDSTSSPRQ